MKPGILLACLLAAACAKKEEPAAPAESVLPHLHYYSLGRN